jgi:MFS superfamily sulfate permease-like transporter
MNAIERPEEGLIGLRKYWKDDILSGFIVFLIALPLSLGIALASGASPIAGVLSTVVGGILVGFISGSYITINGPAAGLIVVVLSAIETLGNGNATEGFEKMLACLVVAGFLQLLFGFFKTGKIFSVFPPSVLHGMLAAIGLIIMIKQYYVFIGTTPTSKTLIDSIIEMPSALVHLNPEVTLIGFVSLGICIFLPLVPNYYIKKIPAPLVAVIAGIFLGEFFDLEHEHHYVIFTGDYSIGPAYLVNIPSFSFSLMNKPNFSSIFTVSSVMVIFTLFFVASLESLLSAKAIDHLDPYHRKTNLDKELIGKGIGNMILGFIGGLPIIAEIVRSSANVQNGAKTKWANFFHGLFLLIFVVSVPSLIHKIPLSSLAGILIYVGFRLAHPGQLKDTLFIGLEQLLYFSATVYFTISYDLLIGIFAGLITKVIYDISQGEKLSNMFRFKAEPIIVEDTVEFQVSGVMAFTNFLSFKNFIKDYEHFTSIKMNLSKIVYIDHTSYSGLVEIQKQFQSLKREFLIVGLEDMRPFSAHPLCARKRDAKLTV